MLAVRSFMKFTLQGQAGSYGNVSRCMLSVVTRQNVAPPHSEGVPLWGAKANLQRKETANADILLGGLLSHYLPLPKTVHAPNKTVNLECLRLPTNIGWTDPTNILQEEISVMNRNARRPNRANHGARPCSRSSRRWKKEKVGKRRR